MMEVTKVWWDGNKIMAEPVDPASVYSDIVSDGGHDPRNKFDKPAQQEPVAWMDIDEKGAFSGLRYWSEPDNRHEVALYTSPPAQQEPVAWPCLIAEADFSEDTVTLAMQCTDYKVSAGKHWLSNTPPAQQEPMDFDSLFHEAEEIVRQKPTWERFIDGTPLSNDIAVWMTVFAQDVARRTSPPAQPVQDNPLDCGVHLGSGKDHEIKHHISYGPEPIDTLIAAWQALEETSDRVPDEGNVEGRIHMSVIRSAWKQMDSLVRDLWDKRGRP